MRALDSKSSFAALGVAVALALACAACATPPPDRDTVQPAAATEGDERDGLLEAHLALMRAFENGDADSLTRLLDESGGLLVFHPMKADRFDGIEQVQEGLSTMFSREGSRTWSEYHPLLQVAGDVGWITSHSTIEAPTRKESVAMRGTEVWRRRAGTWRLVHAHWSVQP